MQLHLIDKMKNIPNDSSSSVVNKGGKQTAGSSHSLSVLSSDMNGRNGGLAKYTLQMIDYNLGCGSSSRTSNGQNSSELNLDLELKQPNKPEPNFNWVGTGSEPNIEIIDLTLSLPGNDGVEKNEDFNSKSASSEGTEKPKGRNVAEHVNSSTRFTFDLNLVPVLEGGVDVPIDASMHSEVNKTSDKVPLDFIPEDPSTQKNKTQGLVTNSSFFTEDEGGISVKSLYSDLESVELNSKESSPAKPCKTDRSDTGFASPKVNNEDEGGKSSYSDLEAVELNNKESSPAKDSKSNCLDIVVDSSKVNNEDEGGIDVKSSYSDLEYVEQLEVYQKECNSAKDRKSYDLDVGFDSTKVITEDEGDGGTIAKSSNSDLESAELDQNESNSARDSKSVDLDADYDLPKVNSNENNVGVEEDCDEVESDEDVEEFEDVAEEVHYDEESNDYDDGDVQQREDENSTDVEDAMGKHVPNTEECIEMRELGIVIKPKNPYPCDLDGPATTSKTKHESRMKKCLDKDIVKTTVAGNNGRDFTRRVESTINRDYTRHRYKRVQDDREMEYNVGPYESSYRKENPYRGRQTVSFKGKEKFFDKSFRPYRRKGKFFNKSFGRGKPQPRWNRDESMHAEEFHETGDAKNQVNQFGKRRLDYSWIRKDHSQNFSSPENAPDQDSPPTFLPSRRQSKFGRRGHTQPAGNQHEEQNTRQFGPHGRYTEREINSQTQGENSISPNILRSPYPFNFNPSPISQEIPTPNLRRMDIRHNELAAGGPHFYAQGFGVQYGLPQPAYPQMNRNFAEREDIGSSRDRLGGYANDDFGVERHHRVWSEQYGADFGARKAPMDPEGESWDPIGETSLAGRSEYYTRTGWQSTGFGEARERRRRY